MEPDGRIISGLVRVGEGGPGDSSFFAMRSLLPLLACGVTVDGDSGWLGACGAANRSSISCDTRERAKRDKKKRSEKQKQRARVRRNKKE